MRLMSLFRYSVATLLRPLQGDVRSRRLPITQARRGSVTQSGQVCARTGSLARDAWISWRRQPRAKRVLLSLRRLCHLRLSARWLCV
jgi:hypothetical protein